MQTSLLLLLLDQFHLSICFDIVLIFLVLGLSSIDPSEKYECAAIRKSRTECGCTCASGLCDPQSCECALNGIPCQVDRESFPCACLSPGHCSNPEGRVEFNPVRVRTHYLHTRMRIDEEEREETTATPVPVKRFCPIEVPLYSDLVSNAICFSHKSEVVCFNDVLNDMK